MKSESGGKIPAEKNNDTVASSPADQTKKKSKGSDGLPDSNPENPKPSLESPARRKISYKHTLTGQVGTNEDTSMADGSDPEDDWVDEFGPDSDAEEEDEDDPKCPTIRLSAEDKRILWSRWKWSLIVNGKRGTEVRSACAAFWVILIGLGMAAGGGYLVYKYRLRSYMDSEIRAIMPQYMPLDSQAEILNHANDERA